MKITIESTDKIVTLKPGPLLEGVQARVWEGETESGVPVHVFITRLAVPNDKITPEIEDRFLKELVQTKLPSTEIEAYPLRMIID